MKRVIELNQDEIEIAVANYVKETYPDAVILNNGVDIIRYALTTAARVEIDQLPTTVSFPPVHIGFHPDITAEQIEEQLHIFINMHLKHWEGSK